MEEEKEEQESTHTSDIIGYQNYQRIDLLCGFPWKPQYEINIGESLGDVL